MSEQANASPDHLVRAKDEYQAQALVRALIERNDQDTMWGNQTHDPVYWLAILGKQSGQMGSAILDWKWSADEEVMKTNFDRIYGEVTQVVAVGLCMMEQMLKGQILNEVSSVKPDPRRLANLLHKGDESLDYDGHHDDDPQTEYSDAAVADPIPADDRIR